MSIFGLDLQTQLLEDIKNKLDITLTELRDALRGTGNKTLTDLYSKLDSLDNALDSVGTDKLRVTIVGSLPETSMNLTKINGTSLTGRDWSDDFAKLQNLNTTLSSRASESTLSGIKTQTDKFSFDGSSYLYVNAAVVANPSNLDVLLSSRASESTLSSLSEKFPSATSLSDSLSNPTTTIIGSALLGWTSSAWIRLAADTSGRLKTTIDSLPSLPSGSNIIGGVFADYSSTTTINQQVGTSTVTGSTVDCTKRGRKIIYINNTEDVSVTVTIEGSYNGSEWYTIRDNISIPANSTKIGILNDAYGYIRAKATASSTPSTGLLKITVSSMT